MWVVSDDLRRVLPEVSNLRLERNPLSLFCDLIKIDAVLVGERIEDIHMLNRVLASLFVAVDEIDPVVD